VDNTKAIYKVVKLSLKKEKWAVWNCMQWFVKEQVGEETFALNLLDKMKIAESESMHSNALYLFDKEMKETPNEVIPAQKETTKSP
jgi:ferritin